MHDDRLAQHFEAMGSRIRFRALAPARRWIHMDATTATFTLDVLKDKKGEYFELARGDGAPRFELLQIRPKQRHLLLMSSDGERYLCGHDERHWFVAAVGKPVSTVRAAKQALMPEEVWNRAKRLSPGDVDNRKNVVFLRQGEWFFVPVKRRFKGGDVILKNEPLQRSGASKPHVCEELVRWGGRLIYVVQGRQWSESEYRRRKEKDPRFGNLPFRTMMADPEVYVRGCVRHADHATLRLRGWHRVFINAEPTTSTVAFLD